MKTLKLLFAAAVPSFVLCGLAACASDNFANGQDQPSPEPTATTDDAGPDVAAIPTSVVNGGACSNLRLPTEDACVLNDVFGVFVSSSKGSDASGEGTRARPFATLKRALDAAAPTRKRVYACNERYDEAVTLADGVAMFGYLDCARDWAVTPAVRADVQAPASPALKAANLTAATRVEGFSFSAPNGSAGAPSSIGFIADAVADLSLFNVRVVAGDALDGTSGVEPAQAVNGGNLGGGNNVVAEKCPADSLICQSVHSGKAGGTNDCGGIGVTGGVGGAGGFGGIYFVGPGPVGGPAKVVSVTEAPGLGDALAATAVTAQGGTANKAGANGANGTNGTNGASSTGGVITANGYTPGDGTAGTSGAPGQGGGGGAGVQVLASSDLGSWFGAPGAGGGAGGCPGLAGTAGKGGGASIAVIAMNSKLRFDDTSVIEAGRGGNGGRGTFGSVHTTGGVAGSNVSGQTPPGAGSGGDGGHSGISGHGAGGPSIGIAWKGTKPEQGPKTKIKNGAPGAGHAEESRNTGGEPKTLALAPAGVGATVYPIP